MLIERPPLLYRLLFPEGIWRIKRGGGRRVVYLTFDDGPVPEVTPWVLDTLDRYGIKATFFLVGDNVARNPGLFEEIKRRGHSWGNHTMHHLQGRLVSTYRYMHDISEANSLIGSPLFRPPSRADTLEAGPCHQGSLQHNPLRPRDARLLAQAHSRKGVQQRQALCTQRLYNRVS